MNKIFTYLKIEKEDQKLLINFILYIVIALIFFLGIEGMQRGAAGEIAFIKAHKFVALLNYVTMLIVISPALFFKRTHFAALILGLPWVILGTVSAMLLKFRGMPLRWADFYSFGEGTAIAGQYLTKEIIVQLCVGSIVTIIVFIGMFLIKFKTYKVHFVKRTFVYVIVIGLLLLTRYNLMERGVLDSSRWDITAAYEHNGFIYSFAETYLTSFRKPAEGYSSKTMGKVAEAMSHSAVSIKGKKAGAAPVSKASSQTPNIIMVQTEAFCDPTIIKEAKFNEDPIPNFRKYFNEGYSGHLQVPTIGGATVRTEFEVLTGVSMDYLAPGEIPYNSGLIDKESIETMAYVLKKAGYEATAIHNFEGNFYSRNKVFENFGFDRFVPMESMNHLVKYRPFPEDYVLLDYIKQAVSSTKNQDFIFTITAGTHGPYSTTVNKGNEKYVSGPLKDTSLHQLQNYTSLVRRTDKFIGELAEYVYSLKEPTVLIVYSDHYPKLEAIEGLTEKQKFETPYFIIDNQNKLPKTKGNDVEAYQLSTDVFNLNHLEGGVMNKFHNAYRGKDNYQNELELIQYDMLFGKKYCMNNKNPYTPTVIQIGLEKLEIDKTEYSNNSIHLYGTGFTKSSKIFFGGKLLDTEFVSDKELIGKNIQEPADSVQVKLLGRDDLLLSDSNTYAVHE